MKKTCIFLCLIVFAVLQAYAASSWKETRTVVFTPVGSEKHICSTPIKAFVEPIKFDEPGVHEVFVNE